MPGRTSLPQAAVATLLCVLATLTALADSPFANPESAYELTRGQILALPRNNSGRLSVRPCADCEPVTLTVTGATQYFIRPGSADVTLSEWLAEERDADYRRALVYVFFDATDRRVTRLVLDRD